MLERRDHHWIVMTPSGEFYKIPPGSREVTEGDEIEFVPPKEQPVRTVRRPRRSVTYAAVACLMILLSGVPLWNLLFTSAYAAVSIDINPSFELEVDKRYQVMDLHPLNEEAKALAPSIEWRNRELTAVASEIIQDARQEGFLKQNRDVLIVPVGLDDAKASREVLHKIEQQASELAKQGGEGVTITLMESTKEARKQAQKEGMSVGKYALYDSVRQMDNSLSPDKLKDLSISEISSAIGGMERVPNTQRYTNQPVRKPDPAPKSSAHPEEKEVKPVAAQQNDEPVKTKGNKQQVESSKKPTERDRSTAVPEHGPKTKTVPKAVTEETKRKAEVQAKKGSVRTEEEKKYKSEYGRLQQNQQQGGQAADEKEKKRNAEYKKEREKKQTDFQSPLE